MKSLERLETARSLIAQAQRALGEERPTDPDLLEMWDKLDYLYNELSDAIDPLEEAEIAT